MLVYFLFAVINPLLLASNRLSKKRLNGSIYDTDNPILLNMKIYLETKKIYIFTIYIRIILLIFFFYYHNVSVVVYSDLHHMHTDREAKTEPFI